jgi:hypothetical protein
LAQKRGQNRSAAKARRVGPAGVQERGIGARGLPRNLGEPANSAKAVPPSQGTTLAKREGPQAVVAAHRTEEAGEGARPTPSLEWDPIKRAYHVTGGDGQAAVVAPHAVRPGLSLTLEWP